MVGLEKRRKDRIFFFVFVHLVAGHGLRKLQVVQDIFVARVQAEGALVIEYREAEIAVPKVGIAQVVEQVGVLETVVDAGTPFVNGAFEVVLLVGLGAGFNTGALLCGVCGRTEHHRDCK